MKDTNARWWHQPEARTLSAIEFLFGAAIVIGHNVFQVVPNEVPILFVIAMLSVRLRKHGWAALGFRQPALWPHIVLIALAAAALRIVLGEYVILPFTGQFWPEPAAPADAESIVGNAQLALMYLLIVWGFAAFGEEISYRGYLLTRAAEAAGGSKAAWWIGMVLVSILFGYGHFYKGPAGILDSGIAGLILGAVYLLTGRNLWASILTHGFIDTFAVISEFLGWNT